jgi:hypothetical protein
LTEFGRCLNLDYFGSRHGTHHSGKSMDDEATYQRGWFR